MAQKFPWTIYWVVLALIAVVALFPVGSVALCYWIANGHGCTVDEGFVHPCMIGGKDYGELLYTMGVLGWLMLLTIPSGVIFGIVWLVVLLIHRSSWGKARTATVPPEQS